MMKENEGRYAPHYSMTLRVKPSVGRLLEETARKMGQTKTAVIVFALRELAKREGVKVDEAEEGATDAR